MRLYCLVRHLTESHSRTIEQGNRGGWPSREGKHVTAALWLADLNILREGRALHPERDHRP